MKGRRQRERRRRIAPALVLAATLCPYAGALASDLTHPSYTARGALAAQLVSPAAGGVASNSSVTFDVSTTAGAGVELAVNGTIVPFSRIGKRTVDSESGATHYFYYGVALLPGPNDVVLTALGAHGARGAATHANVFGQGRATHAKISVSGPLRADGVSLDTVSIAATDEWGHPALAGSPIHIVVVKGDVCIEPLPDLAAVTKSPSPSPPPSLSRGAGKLTPVRVLDVPIGANGLARVRLVPGLVPGDVVLRATIGDLEAVGHLFLAPNLRRPLVNGLVTGGVGNLPGDPAAADGSPDGVNSRRGRVALYATGAIDATTLATLAYDTAHRLQQDSATGAFTDDPNERPYATYGDASIRRDDALSRDHLFAQIDRGRSSFTWGEFDAVTSPSTDILSGYNALVDGAHLEIAGATRKLSLFAAKNDVAFDRRVFAPSGLASLGQVLFPDIVVGSETVTLVSLDRRTGAVVNQSVLTPNVDYVLDDATGQFRFINIPLPFDDIGNPQQVVLTYEYAGVGARAGTLGGRAEFALSNHLVLGTGYVNDTGGAGNMTLLSEDLAGPLKNGSWSIANVASNGDLGFTDGVLEAPSRGDALRAAFTTAGGSNSFSGSLNDTTAGFSNPFGGLSTPGLLDMRGSYTRRLSNGAGDLSFTVDRQANSGVGIADRQAEAALRLHRILSNRFGFTLGLIRQMYRADAPPVAAGAVQPGIENGTSTLATLSANYGIGKNLTVDASRAETVAGPQISSQPNASQLQIAYRIADSGRVYLRENWSGVPAQSFAASTVGLASAAAATRSTEFGIERTLSPTLSADSEYLVQSTSSGTDLYAAMGVRERLVFSKSLNGDTYYQQADAAGINANGFTAYGASLNFTNSASGFRSTASLQQRNGSGNGTTFSLAAAGSVVPDVSLFASVLGSRAAGSFENSARVGMAWRPANSDRGVTLAQFEKLSGTSALISTQSGVVSLEQLYRPRARLEISGRYAYKVEGDTFYAAHTSLIGLRADQRVGARFDIGVEGRTTFARDIPDATNVGASAEFGLRLADTVRVATGYNLKRSADPALSQTPVNRGFYLTVTSIVDQLLGWGRER